MSRLYVEGKLGLSRGPKPGFNPEPETAYAPKAPSPAWWLIGRCSWKSRMARGVTSYITLKFGALIPDLYYPLISK